MDLKPAFLASACLLALAPIPGSSQEFAYVVNSRSSDISAYRVDPVTGTLTQIPGSPFAAINETNSVTIDPLGRFLYVTNENADNISGYSINPVTGALTPIAGSPFASGAAPNSAKIDPAGRFLYVANESDMTISGYAINQTTGALTALTGSPFSTGTARDDSLAFSKSGAFLYTDDNSSPGAVLGFSVNPATGALTPIAGSPFLTGGNSTDSVTVDPSGRFLYAANFNSNTVSAFTINAATGALTQITGSPFSVGGSPDQVTVDPSGRFAFTANDGSSGPSAVGAFAINQTTGALTPITGTPFAAGNSPSGVTVDPSDRFLLAANENSGDVSVFTINTITGALTMVAGSPFPAGGEPTMIAVVNEGNIGAFQVRYLSNLNIGDSVIDITNTGASSTTARNGNLCANVYVFSPDEQLVACCACPITPNGLASLSARNDLIVKTLTPSTPASLVVKLLATAETDVPCDAATAERRANPLVPGLAAWATTLHALPPTPGSVTTPFGETETPFTRATLSAAELERITTLCGFNQTNGSGFGICNSCRPGGLGASKQ